MKTKLFITIVTVVSAVVVASGVAGSTNDASAMETTEETCFCGIYSDWDDVIC